MNAAQRLVFLALVVAALTGFPATSRGAPPAPAGDDDIHAMIAAAGDSKAYDKAATVVVLDESDVYVQPGGLATTHSCEVVKILTDEGVRSRSVLRLEYNPDTYRAAFESVRIHRQDGAVEDVPLSAVVTQPTPQHMIYWGGEQRLLTVPRLAVGDTLEIRIAKIGFNVAYLGDGDGVPAGLNPSGLQPPMPGHWHETMIFPRDCPVLKKRYSVHMPKDKPLQFEVYNGPLKTSLWFDGDHNVYTFTAEDLPAIKAEPHMVALDDCTTKVVLSTVPDWETKSRWFWEANQNQFDADDAVRDLARKLTAGLKSDEARIAALNHWVADNVRYYGTSRGPREGFTLHTGIETLRDLGGVCKDKAGMLVTLLRAAGFEAYPALTMAGSRVEAIPADQFNHTVTAVRRPDGQFDIYDPTWIPASREMWSSREALQGLVYGTPTGETLTLSPYYPPEYNRLEIKADTRISPDGTLSSHLVMDLAGYPCTYLRRNLDKNPTFEQRAAFEQALRLAPTARVESLTTSDPYDYSRNSSVDVRVAATGQVIGDGRVRMFRLPLLSFPLADWLYPDLFYPVDSPQRQYGLVLRATRLLCFEEKVSLPPGWEVARLPEAKKLDSPSASLSFEVTREEGGLLCRLEIAIKNQTIPPKDYPEFKKAIDAMHKLTDEWVNCLAQDASTPDKPAAGDSSGPSKPR